MDCLFTAIMGYSKENGFGTSWTGVALLSLIMGAKLFENVGGTLIFGILASAIYAIIMAFIRLAFIYMLSIMGLILLYTIAPLFIPMMMFQRTKMMFERWYQTVISFIMQVCIMFAFFSFIAPIIYDIALGPNGLVAMYKELKAQNQIASMKTSGVEDTFDQVIGIFSDGDDKTKELIYNFISLLMMSYLVLSFIKFIDQLAHELAGSISARNLSTYAPQAMGSGFQLFGGK
jgi:type IV secretory pathway VirB6-like protein